MFPTRQLKHHLNNKQVDLFLYFLFFFLFFSYGSFMLYSSSFTPPIRGELKYDSSSRWKFSRDRATFVVKCIMRLSTSLFSVRRLMERRSAAGRCEFPRFSVSPVAVTLSYFRRPHRNWKVRLTPRRIQSSDNFSEESLSEKNHPSLLSISNLFNKMNKMKRRPHSTIKSE